MLREHNARYEQESVLLVIGYMPLARVPEAAISFSYLLARVNDLLLLIGHRVHRSFKEDLEELIEQQFGAIGEVLKNSPVDQGHIDYVVDFVI